MVWSEYKCFFKITHRWLVYMAGWYAAPLDIMLHFISKEIFLFFNSQIYLDRLQCCSGVWLVYLMKELDARSMYSWVSEPFVVTSALYITDLERPSQFLSYNNIIYVYMNIFATKITHQFSTVKMFRLYKHPIAMVSFMYWDLTANVFLFQQN